MAAAALVQPVQQMSRRLNSDGENMPSGFTLLSVVPAPAQQGSGPTTTGTLDIYGRAVRTRQIRDRSLSAFVQHSAAG